ncbi:hypothetical protein ABW20_dc0102866 [Dactylellina cionopaga]|nr:hypothetical protein ABW20_dc0102866 [Dactylellina cionopaga]
MVAGGFGYDYKRMGVYSCNNPYDIAANNNGLIAATILDITSDIGIIILPYRLLMCLRIKTRHKVIIFGIFNIGIFLVFLGIFRIVLLYKARTTHSIWLNGIVAAQFGQIFGTVAVITAILPALRLFFTEEQRKVFTQDVEKIQKAKAAGAAASGDTTLFSTTWSPEEGEQMAESKKAAEGVQTIGIENSQPTTGEGSNISTLRGLRNLIRRDSNMKTTTPPPEHPGVHIHAHPEVPPIQVKLQQVIPDIGGETSPAIRRR